MVRNVRNLTEAWRYSQRVIPRGSERPKFEHPWQEDAELHFDFAARWWPADKFDWPTEAPKPRGEEASS